MVVEQAVANHILGRAVQDVSEEMAKTAGQDIDLHLLYARSTMLLLEELVRAQGADQQDCPDREYAASLTQAQPFTVRKDGRKHWSLLTPVDVTLVIQTPVGNWTLALKAGWNTVDPPDGSLVSISGAGGQPAALGVMIFEGGDARNVHA